jgi:tetratricopeptide (TPR) repeat protein
MVGDIHGELDALNELITLNPNSIDLYKDRIELKRRAGHSEECKEDYLRIIALISPVSEQDYMQRALYKEYVDDITGALGDYAIIITLNSKNHDAILKSSKLKQSIGDLNGAVEILQKGRNSDFTNSQYIYALNEIKFLQARDELAKGNKQRALELYSEIISNEPYEYEALFERGLLNYSLSKYVDAKSDFSKVNEITRQDRGSEGLNYECFYWEAAAAIKLGKRNEAKVLIKGINEISPDYEVPEELKNTLEIK